MPACLHRPPRRAGAVPEHAPCPGCGATPAAVFALDRAEGDATQGAVWMADVPASPLEIRDALLRLMTDLAARGIGDAARGDLELVLAEMMNNVAEHGYPPEARGRMTLEVEVLPTTLVCRLIDRGRALPGGRLPAPAPFDPRQTQRHLLPEGGYGWSLIHAITDRIRYRRCGDCNCLAFVLITAPETPD